MSTRLASSLSTRRRNDAERAKAHRKTREQLRKAKECPPTARDADLAVAEACSCALRDKWGTYQAMLDGDGAGPSLMRRMAKFEWLMNMARECLIRDGYDPVLSDRMIRDRMENGHVGKLKPSAILAQKFAAVT